MGFFAAPATPAAAARGIADGGVKSEPFWNSLKGVRSMLRKWTSALALAALVVLPLAGQAQGDKQGQKAPPTIVVRLQSFDAVVDNIKTISKAVGKEEIGKQIVSAIKAQTGPDGLDGVDTKKPIGISVNLAGDFNSIYGVIMVPIKDQQKFLALLKNVNYPATKGKDNDIYEIEQNQVPGVRIGLRFLNGYAYISGPNPDILAKAEDLPTPAQVFAKGQDAVVSGVVRLDQIPEAFKANALMQLEDIIKTAKDKAGKDADTPAQKKLAADIVESGGKQLANFLKGATEVSGQLTINPKTHEIGIELSADGKKNSELDKTIAGLAKHPSIFGGLVKKGGDAVVAAHAVLPPELKASFNAVVDEALKKGLESEPDANKKAFAQKFFDAITPTLHSGDFDVIAYGKAHKNGQVTAVAGMKVQQAEKLTQTLRDLHKQLPATEQDHFKLDVSKVGTTSVHQVNIKLAPKEQKILGDGPLFIAITDQALFVATGKDALAALKDALETPAAPGTSLLHYEIKLAQLADLETGKDQDKVKAAAKKAFANDPGVIRFTIEGGQKLQIRISAGISVLDFAVSLMQKNQDVKFLDGAR